MRLLKRLLARERLFARERTLASERLFARALILALLLTLIQGASLAGPAGQTAGNALVRFVHVLSGASAVDVYTDGQLTIRSLDFGQSTPYVNLAPGPHQVVVTQAGATTALWQQPINPAVGAALTLVAASNNPLQFQVYQDDLSPLPLGKSRFTAVHAIADGPSLDVILSDGRPVVAGLQFGQPYGTLDLPAFAYDLAPVPAGQSIDAALVPPETLPMATGTSYMLVVFGTSTQPQMMWLAAPTTPDSDSGFVRFADAAPGASAVDIYLNDTLAVPSLSFDGKATQYIALPVGSYNVAVREAGSTTDVATTTLDVTSGERQTAAVMSGTESTIVTSFPDHFSAITATAAGFNLINTVSGDSSASATLSDGTSLLSDVPSGQASAATLRPGDQTITVNVKVGAQTGSSEFTLPGGIYGGVYYEALAVNGPNGPEAVLLDPVSVALGVNSAGGQPAVASNNTGSEVVQNTATPGSEVVAAATTAPLQETLVPATLAPPATIPATEVPQVVTIVAVTPPPAARTGPTARVVIDPGANLQLREYPSSEARSLGLAPSGSILIVNGREGGIALLIGETPDPSATPFVDPASLLTDPRQDLDPQQTWLNITYNTPDGGSITAWVNSFYLDVRDKNGDAQRLADLPLVASNIPGEALNTAITPPPVPENRVIVTIINVDPGVNVHIRRTEGVDAESLALVPSGAVMEFAGISQDQQWVFVRYTPPEGGIVTGWVSATFVAYTYRNRPIELQELSDRGLLTITPDDTRGALAQGAIAPIQPTANPLKDAIVATVVIDSSANLHLRRTADANSESLALIPSATQLVVTDRTGDGQWLEVTFENQDGWVASAFVRLTKNGQPFDLQDVPIVSGESNAISVTQPAASQATEAPQITGTPFPAMVITVAVVAMTNTPGGENVGLPILTKGTVVYLIGYSPNQAIFVYVQLEDGTRGWLPASDVMFR